MKKKIGIIDTTPTWVDVVLLYLEIIEKGTPKQRDDAKRGILKCAKIAQKYVDEHKKS